VGTEVLGDAVVGILVGAGLGEAVGV